MPLITNAADDCLLIAHSATHSAAFSTKQKLSSSANTTKQSQQQPLVDQSMAEAQEYVNNLVASCYSNAAAMDFDTSLESTFISLKPTT